MNTVYILWARQLKRYWRSRARIIGTLGQPLLFLIAFGYGFGSIFAKAGGGNYMNFLVPGIIAQSILFTAISSGINLIWDRQFGFLKETLAAPVSRLEIMLGQALGGATVSTIQGIIVLGLSLFVGFKPENWLLVPIAILAMFLMSLLFTVLGIAIASKMEDFQGFQLIMNFLVMPLFFLSGALFPIAGMPKRWLLSLNLIL
jgi:ABC-2 type transport system permease protein